MQQMTTNHGRQQVVTLHFDSIDTPHAISTRLGGISAGSYASTNIDDTLEDSAKAVMGNRKLICAAAKLDGRRFATMEQPHHCGIATISLAEPIHETICHGGIDAMLCRTPGITLMGKSADCPLVLLYDETVPAIAVIHSGWRSTVANIVTKAVDQLCNEFGCSPETIRAGIGPGICQDHFQVGREVSDRFRTAFPTLQPDVFMTESGGDKANLDLTAVIEWQLNARGVTHVERAGLCTFERTDLFYSHRRDNGVTGRFGLFAQLK